MKHCHGKEHCRGHLKVGWIHRPASFAMPFTLRQRRSSPSVTYSAGSSKDSCSNFFQRTLRPCRRIAANVSDAPEDLKAQDQPPGVAESLCYGGQAAPVGSNFRILPPKNRILPAANRSQPRTFQSCNAPESRQSYSCGPVSVDEAGSCDAAGIRERKITSHERQHLDP